MRIVAFLAPLALLALAACGGGSGEAPRGKPVTQDELMRIAEAIIVKRYHLNAPSDSDRRQDIFVAVNGKVPPAEFLARLSKGIVRFRPANEYKPGLGTSLSITNFTWTDEAHAKGDIGEVCGPLCGEGHAVVVVLRGGTWTVESMTPTWIS